VTILLAILTFSLSLIGTFLVRSGVLTSVHTFSSDPARGVFILLILVLFIGGSLALFAWRAPLLKQGGLFAPISRESALLFNNLFLATACATVFVGTLYPLVLEALTGDKISVGAPFFNLTFAPLFVPLLMAVPFGPLLAWKRGDLYGVAQRLLAAGGVAAIGLAATFAFAGTRAVFAPFGIGLALFVMAGAITDIAERVDLHSMSLETIGRRAAGLPPSSWGTAVAHLALGITLLGIVCETNWSSERIVALKPTQTVSISGYDLSFDGMVSRNGSNFRETAARFTVRKAGAVIGVMEPSKRTFPSRDGMSTTEAALLTRGASQLYLSLGDNNADGSIAVRLYYKPLTIWLGALVMAIGGALSLSDRRLRIGAPKPAARILAQPAE
jgi:cytochrome c-type biogenesis protein CcmF